MMFAEVDRVMACSIESGQYIESMGENVFAKKSADGIKKTKGFLQALYGFDRCNPEFLAFEYFWKETNPEERPLLALLLAVCNDGLLAESVEVVAHVPLGTKADVDLFVRNIEKFRPKRYSSKTLLSTAQNLASSWKQAGFLEGKVKNIRVQPEITYRVLVFAIFLAHLRGLRGDYLWTAISTKALCSSEQNLRELALEAARNDMIQYQNAGGVTSLGFTTLYQKIGIYEIIH